jgi:hypothetical protein
MLFTKITTQLYNKTSRNLTQLEQSLNLSLAAFNGSGNCDRTNPDSFLKSYFLIKETEIKRLTALLQPCAGRRLEELNTLNRSRYIKLKKHIYYYELAKDNIETAKKLIQTYLKSEVNRVISPVSWVGSGVCDIPSLE